MKKLTTQFSLKKFDTCITNFVTRCGTVNPGFFCIPHGAKDNVCKMTDYTYLTEYTWKTLLSIFYNITVMSHPTSPHKHEKKIKIACNVHAAT
jgi:hypothetical protein